MAPAMLSGKTPTLPCARTGGCVVCPQPGQNVAVSGICAAQCGQRTSTGSTEAGPSRFRFPAVPSFCEGFSEVLSCIFYHRDRAPGSCGSVGHNFLPAVVFAAVGFAAIFAKPVNLERVAGGEVVVRPADFLFEFAHFPGEEFDGPAAPGANHVMVAATIVLVFVARDAVMERNFACQSTFGQKFQRAVHGGVADARVFFLHQTMQFVSGKMIASLEKSPQNGVALGSLFQTDAFQMTVQNILRFADHPPGNAGLVIDALLQHGERRGAGTTSG